MPDGWQSRYGGVAWRLTPAGVEIQGAGIMRTKGEPRTMRLYWAWWAGYYLAATRATGTPVPLLLMTTATENGGFRLMDGEPYVKPTREEPGYVDDVKTPHRISVGPCHLLISTARGVMGNPSVNRAWLMDRGNNILAAARYIASQRDATGFDPILVAAAYNAGSVREHKPGYINRWHLQSYGNHLDRAGAWYGDAVAVLTEAAQALGRVA